jgi:hypothetical protein
LGKELERALEYLALRGSQEKGSLEEPSQDTIDSPNGVTEPNTSERRMHNSLILDLEPGGRLSAKLLPSSEEDNDVSFQPCLRSRMYPGEIHD